MNKRETLPTSSDVNVGVELHYLLKYWLCKWGSFTEKEVETYPFSMVDVMCIMTEFAGEREAKAPPTETTPLASARVSEKTLSYIRNTISSMRGCENDERPCDMCQAMADEALKLLDQDAESATSPSHLQTEGESTVSAERLADLEATEKVYLMNREWIRVAKERIQQLEAAIKEAMEFIVDDPLGVGIEVTRFQFWKERMKTALEAKGSGE